MKRTTSTRKYTLRIVETNDPVYSFSPEGTPLLETYETYEAAASALVEAQKFEDSFVPGWVPVARQVYISQ